MYNVTLETLFPFDFTREGFFDLDFVLDMNVKNFKLVLEITEDEQIATHSAVKHIKSLKSKGFLFAIDDFGAQTVLRRAQDFV